MLPLRVERRAQRFWCARYLCKIRWPVVMGTCRRVPDAFPLVKECVTVLSAWLSTFPRGSIPAPSKWTLISGQITAPGSPFLFVAFVLLNSAVPNFHRVDATRRSSLHVGLLVPARYMYVCMYVHILVRRWYTFYFISFFQPRQPYSGQRFCLSALHRHFSSNEGIFLSAAADSIDYILLLYARMIYEY